MTSNLASIRPEWAAPSHVRAMTTVRFGGVSTGAFGAADTGGQGMNLGARCGDDIDRVLNNRVLLQQQLPARPQWLQQVHGIAVVQCHPATGNGNESEQSRLDLEPVADAAFTLERGVVLAVLTADCLPVFFAHRTQDLVAICHAGWRGLANGVIEATLMAASAASGCALGPDWIAHLGPAIGPQYFEVGEEVRDVFCAGDNAAARCFVPLTAPGKHLADLYGLARLRLQRAGLQTISGGAYCTYRDREQFYSHRRDRVTGRMASLIWIESLT